jgi:hypothetical protein
LIQALVNYPGVNYKFKMNENLKSKIEKFLRSSAFPENPKNRELSEANFRLAAASKGIRID